MSVDKPWSPEQQLDLAKYMDRYTESNCTSDCQSESIVLNEFLQNFAT